MSASPPPRAEQVERADPGETMPAEWLVLATDMGGVGTWSLDLATRVASFSPTQQRLLGFSGSASLAEVLARIHDDDVDEVAAALMRCVEEGEPYEAEFRFRHPERGEVWLGARAGRVEHPGTGAAHVVGVNFDVTRRRTAEIDAREVSREMAHRMKNVFALVTGVARMIARSAEDVPSFVQALGERTAALARLSDMTVQTATRGVSLRELVGAALLPFDASRIRARVDAAHVNNAAAQTLLLALTELATNAVKHGALGERGGDVAVELRIDEGTDLFRLEWVERTEAPVSAPTRTGFGTQVLTRVTRNTHGGDPSIEWTPGGLRFQCDWALSRMVA